MQSQFTTQTLLNVHALLRSAANDRRVTFMIHDGGFSAMVWARSEDAGAYCSTEIFQSIDELYKAVEQVVQSKWPSREALAADLGLNPDGTFIQQAAE